MKRSIFYTIALLTLFVQSTYATPANLNELQGDWHLRELDGFEVRKARAILDFEPSKMIIDGFDACNRINGKLIKKADGTYTSRLRTTRMACRGNLFSFVSQRLHQAIDEGFTVEKASRHGVDGIVLKSKSHELFFKRMGE